MKHNDLNKKINTAFENATPEVFENVLLTDAPTKGVILTMKHNNKKTFAYIAGIAAMFLLLVGIGGAFGYNTLAVNSTVSIDVNPSIELDVNRAGKVLDADALNEEGKEILGTMEDKLEGVHVEVAVNALIGSMVQKGYVSELANSILVSVNSKNAAAGEKLQEQLNAVVAGYLNGEDCDFDGAILVQQVEQNNELKKLAEQYGISLGKAKFISQIITQNTKYTFEELAKLTINELNLLRGVQLEGVEANGNASDKKYIGAEAARDAALTHAGIALEEAGNLRKYEIEMGYEKGVMVYEVEFKYQGYEYEYDIDALTGAVVKFNKELDDDFGSNGNGGNTDVQPDNGNGGAVEPNCITKEAAKEAAVAHAGLTLNAVDYIKAEKDRDDGRIIFEIEFSANGYEYDYDIDGETGKVLKYDREKMDADDVVPPTGGNGNGGNGNGGSGNGGNGGNKNYIGKEEAKKIALAHAGLTGKTVREYECSLDNENGVKVYEIEFTFEGIEYEYDINAQTGGIIKFDSERDDDYFPPAVSPDGGTTTDKVTEDPSTDVIPVEPTYIGKEKAKEIALAHAGLTGKTVRDYECELDIERTVKVYEIDFKFEGIEYEYEINAETGAIITSKTEKDDDYTPAPAPNPEPTPTPTPDPTPVEPTYIGKEKAKEIALADAGLTGKTVRDYECETDIEKGVKVYEISFEYDGVEYDYEINAETGAILHRESERDD